MASIRNLKKEIDNVASDLFYGAMCFEQFRTDINNKNATDIIVEISLKRNEFISRANNPHGTKDRKLTKEYFKKLNGDITQHVDDILKKLEKLEEAGK